MKKTQFCLKTKRLTLAPMTDAQLSAAIESADDPALRGAYLEMQKSAAENPDSRYFCVPWLICEKKTKNAVGEIGFHGVPCRYAAEIGYGIHEDARGSGYASEAAKALIEWAFSQKDVYFIEAESEPDNAASLHILEKLGFLPDGEGAEGPRFVKEKPETAYTALGMSLGLCFGVSLGMTVFKNLPLGVSIGMSIGIAGGIPLGASLDKSENAKRAAAKAARKSET